MALTYRSSVVPNGASSVPYRSGPVAGIVNAGYFTTRSGVPIRHVLRSSSLGIGGMSAGFPCGAPASTHLTIVAISPSLNEGSSLYFWIPIVLSRNHGGISRLLTRSLIERAHGRASVYERSDIGAISSGRWHRTQERLKIGATSFEYVTCRSARAAVCATATAG